MVIYLKRNHFSISGSSFVGEIFNVHKDVFYMFEIRDLIFLLEKNMVFNEFDKYSNVIHK